MGVSLEIFDCLVLAVEHNVYNRILCLIFFLVWEFQSSFASGLYIALVVASNPIPDSHEIEVIRVEHVVMLGSNFKQPFS